MNKAALEIFSCRHVLRNFAADQLRQRHIDVVAVLLQDSSLEYIRAFNTSEVGP